MPRQRLGEALAGHDAATRISATTGRRPAEIGSAASSSSAVVDPRAGLSSSARSRVKIVTSSGLRLVEEAEARGAAGAALLR